MTFREAFQGRFSPLPQVDGRVESGVAPDVAHRGRLLDVDVRQQPRRDDRADASDALGPDAELVGVSPGVKHRADLALQRLHLALEEVERHVRLGSSPLPMLRAWLAVEIR